MLSLKVALASSEVNLHKVLLSAYDKTVRWHIKEPIIELKILSYYDYIRPSEHHNISLQVIFGLALTQIVDIVSVHLEIKNQIFQCLFLKDERNQILTTNCWLSLQWQDFHLQWNKEKYQGISVIRCVDE